VSASEFESALVAPHGVAAKGGDEGAFVLLFRSVQPALLRYLHTLGGPLAEDAAAETWVSVVRNLHRFTGDEAGWRAWVLTIGRARLRDAQRRAARSPATVELEEVMVDHADGTDVPTEVEEIFTTEGALALIGTLPSEQAEVVLLRHVAGLDVAATARVLGKKPGAVRVAAHRGLRRLAETLTAHEQRRETAACNAIDGQRDY
jgi:RNA polymerase sigma-70 factor (ECF subfamily)